MTVPQFALPNHHSLPALHGKGFKILVVAYLVSPELWQPEILIRLWYESGLAVVRVPKTAVDKYHFAPCRERKVRFARKVRPVKTETITESMYKAPHRHFRQRILATDCAHILAAIHTSSFLELCKEPI
jgi:phenylpropionate dioxygenase-like ring-hydroxylating dioxygenase large terminal subunit